MTGACLLSGTTAALIPAAGSGTRLGLGHKAFVTVGGRSLLARSVAALAPHVDEVLVALPDGLALPPDLALSPRWSVRTLVGGDTRQDSVRRLLRATVADTVLIHDAARPFLSAALISALLEAVAETGAATLALPVADTLVQTGGEGLWGAPVSRDGLWAVQTPQAFHRELLVRAHAQAAADGYAATDDAGLIARQGGRVRLVRGDARLFKVTTPGDLALAQALAPVWDGGWGGRDTLRGVGAPASDLPSSGYEMLGGVTLRSPAPIRKTYLAPAKVNLGLSVRSLRADGYHELHSLMVPLAVGDELEVAPAQTLTLEVIGADLPADERNLVYRAARAYLAAAGVTSGAAITLHKRLPLASGLGGGSSDAATTLMALARLYPAPVSLPDVALGLGADVPFFLLGQAAIAEGIGERLLPVPVPHLSVVLVNPGVEVSARDAYAWLDDEEAFTPALDVGAILAALGGGGAVPYINALQDGVGARHAPIREALAALAAAGLRSPLMSGSGSTCFALATSDDHAYDAAQALASAHPDWWVQATQTL